MKRICSALLTLALCLSLTAPVAAAEPEPSKPDPTAALAGFTDAAEITHREAVAALTQLEVINGKEDGSYFDPTGTVTRGEAAKLITLMRTGGKDLSSDEVKEVLKDAPTFSDVQGHWAEPYIEYCAKLGFVSGNGLGVFDPDGTVTALAFVKMALAMLGYDPAAYGLTGRKWADNTDELARYAVLPDGLYGGLPEVDLNGPVTREVAAQVLYNALRSQPRVIKAQPNGDGTTGWAFVGATDLNGTLQTFLKTSFGLDAIPIVPAQPPRKPAVSAFQERADPNDFADLAEVKHREAVEAVVRLGIMKGKEDGSYFAPQDTVTRGEAARTVAVMMFGGVDVNTGVKETPSFSDIRGHWAEPYIEYLFDMGIAIGGDGAFDPNGPLTLSELLRMALTALGYDAAAFRLTGEDWQSQVDALAKATGGCKLTQGIPEEADRNAPVTREVLAQVLYNALQARPMLIVPDPGTGEAVWQHKQSGDTLLHQRFGLTGFPARAGKNSPS